MIMSRQLKQGIWFVKKSGVSNRKNGTSNNYKLFYGNEVLAREGGLEVVKLKPVGPHHDSGTGAAEKSRLDRVAAMMNEKGLKPSTHKCWADFKNGNPPKSFRQKMTGAHRG